MAEYINKEEILKFPIRIHHCDREHDKICYFNSKRRFIRVKNKRYYI